MAITFDLEKNTLLREAMEEVKQRVQKETTERVQKETAERVRKETAERVQRETAERVRQQTIDTIVTIMRRRFNEDVPAGLRQRLESYAQDELRDITVRAATAASAEEALDYGSASIAPR